MANIIERRTADGEARYVVRVRRKGRPTQTATFKRKTDAQRWARKTETAIDEGRHFQTSEAKRRTLSDLVERYIADIIPTKADTVRGGQATQLRWWQSQLGAYTLSDISPALITECRDTLSRSTNHRGKKYAPATVVRYLSALSHAFTVAEKEWQWCTSNPVKSVRKPREPRGRVRFLSDTERAALLDACRQSDNPYLYPVVVLALSTGMRQAEIMGLSWADIDLARQRITIHKTKNGERRGVPLAGHALEVVQAFAKVRRIDTALIFPGKTGKPAIITKPWNHAVESASLEDFRFHDLRHTAASYLAMNGASLLEIAEILGHKTLQMVKRYAHLADSHTAKVVARMNTIMFS